MTRVFAQTNPIPLSMIATVLTAMSKKGWRHEATIQVGVGKMQGGIVNAAGKDRTDIAVISVLSGLVEDPDNYALPNIEL